MCGSTVTRTQRAVVERTILNVCSNCERFGKVLSAPAARDAVVPGNVPMAMEKRKRQQAPSDVYATEAMSLEMVPDFAQRIKLAREKKGWTRQDLGGRVGEREPTIARIEAGALHPTDSVAKKMERELGIRLFESVSTGATKATPTRGMTLGDMLRDATRKKDE